MQGEGLHRPKMASEGTSCFHSNLPFFFNILFFFFFFFFYGSCSSLKWSQEAALEAEAISSISCSGHGEAFVDGILDVDGMPVCECHECFGGPECSELDANCVVDVNSGDPLYLEQYWRQHAESGAVVISGWHRMSYTTDSGNRVTIELEKQIRRLHAYAGNAITDGRFIVVGVGTTQLLNALVYSLSPCNATLPAKVVGSAPYYNLYELQTKFFNSKAYEWVDDAMSGNNKTSKSATLIEFVTSPNNPDGLPKRSVLNGSLAIHDHVYYWPHYTAIPSKANEDIMLFSMSKVSGHAGSRLGWAILKNEEIYNRVMMYVLLNNLGISHDTQLRMLKLIKAMAAQRRGEEGDIFTFGYEKMSKRWKRLNDILESSKRFSLQSIHHQYCTYFKKIRDPSPAYAWLKCNMEEDKDCYEVLRNASIIGREGTQFGDSKKHVRLSLIKRDDNFEMLLEKLEALVSTEGARRI